jgi:hypothetical protein
LVRQSVHVKLQTVTFGDMIGPLPSGTYTGPHCGTRWESLEAGKSFLVVKEFKDSDQDVHPVGESWKLLGCTYNKYDEVLSLFVTFNNGQEWHIPLRHSPDEQGVILDNLADFISQK